MKQTCLFSTLLFVVFSSPIVQAQGLQQPTEEHKLLKEDVGTWAAEMKIWMPGSDQPITAKGTEVNEMFGEFWLVSKFEADMMGQAFKGRASMGYDPIKKKYVGTWFDNMNPHMSFMEGTYDEKTKTMTFATQGIGVDGKPMRGKNVAVTKEDGTRVFTMYQPIPGSDQLHKGMEVTYTKK